MDRVFGEGIPMISGVVNTVEYIKSTYGRRNIVGSSRLCDD